MFSLISTLPFGAAISPVSAQFIPAPQDLKTALGYANVTVRYKEVLTGICELDPDVKSYSGYVDVSENEHIFFWFFEARNKDPDAPLSVWINGGPGSSSMIGLFQENGPCDQPAQVGFSYSIPVNGYTDNDSNIVTLPDAKCPDHVENIGICGTYSYGNQSLTANSTSNAAPNFWKTIQGFMGAFPQYSRHGFHFTTESYGGHYGPIFNDYIEKQNAKDIPGAHNISLESVLIGNGWFDPVLQYQAYYNFTHQSSVLQQSLRNGNCLDQVKDCAARGLDEICAAADAFCANLVENVYDKYLGRDEYDIRELTPDPFPYNFYVNYLNKPEILAAIGAYTTFSESSNAVAGAFTAPGDDDREAGTIEAIRRLLKQGVTVLLYAGDADYNCNWLGVEAVTKEINYPGFDKAGYVNISTSDSEVHGQVKQANKFSFARIYNSGHEVPFYQPLLSLTIFTRAIHNLDIATGKLKPERSYHTKGTLTSTYREGNETMQFHVLPGNATYNYTTGEPNGDVGRWKGGASDELRRRGVLAENREGDVVRMDRPGRVGRRFRPS